MGIIYMVKMKTILLCLLPTIVLLVGCEGWIGPELDPRSGSRYYISEKGDVRTQVSASSVCRLNGWILAAVKRWSQQKTIEKLANEAKVKEDIWIGLKLYRNITILEDGKDYGEWSDGTPFNISKNEARYHNWHFTEPITYKTLTQRTVPTCVRLWQEQDWTWDDYYCNYTLTKLSRYVCEAKAKTNYRQTDHVRISRDLIKNTREVKSNPSNLESLSNAVNELLTVKDDYHENNKNNSRQVLRAFDKFVYKYNSQKNGDFHSDKDNVEVDIINVEKNASFVTDDTKRTNDSNNNIQIYLRPEVLNEAASRYEGNKKKTVDKLQVNLILYKNPALFQVDERRYRKSFLKASNLTYKSRALNTSMFGEEPSLALLPVLISDVLSIEIKNVNMTNLKHPICVTNYDYFQNTTPPAIPDMIARVSPSCAFWDVANNEWSTKGCRVLKPLEERAICGNATLMQNRSDRVICICDHMTHFSILLDTTYTYAPKYLIHITIFGCVMSIVCLFGSIVTILRFSQLRSKTPQQILLQLCINLFIMNILFLVGIDKRDDVLFCTVIAAMLHYFLLAAWAWMLIEAIFLFLRLVVTSYNGGVRGKIVPIGGVLAYGIPGLITGMTVGITRSDVYLSEKYCWLSMNVLVPSLLVPIALILFCNLVIFVSVIYTITFKSKMYRKRMNLLKVRQTLIRAFCMIFILGIPWLFGFFMLLAQTPDVKEVFAVCFTVLNTLQGVAIFFFFCLRQEQVRKLWLTPLNHKLRQTIRRARPSRKQRRRSSSISNSKRPEGSDDTDTKTLDNTRTNTLSNGISPGTLKSQQSTEEMHLQSASSSSAGISNPFRHGWG